jgi:hypothetical protein
MVKVPRTEVLPLIEMAQEILTLSGKALDDMITGRI